MEKFSNEFKQDALRMCERECVSAVSAKLGEPTKALYNWKHALRLNPSLSGGA